MESRRSKWEEEYGWGGGGRVQEESRGVGEERGEDQQKQIMCENAATTC